MHKMEKAGGKFFVQWETHSKQTSKGLCMLMERQFLVDIAICCGSNTIHAHKCVLAANSSYFKEHFENKAIEQVVINGVDFSVMKAIIEFMYCGECVVGEEHLKHFIAAVKLFKISILENIFAESEYQSVTADEVVIPPLQFICKPPKYPTVFKPFNNAPMPPKINYALNNIYNQHKFKRKSLGSEAEKACAKEAQASRIALANLRKVMASSPQVHSFIVEESFNETTVENFIPNVEENYDQNVHEVQFPQGNTPQAKSMNMIPVSIPGNGQGLTADKIKHILGNDEVEIMFQTSDGNFVNVSDEVLLNLSKGGLQYQVVDENGHVGELQELKTLETEVSGKSENETFGEDTALKREGNFEIKIVKNSEEIGKLVKAPMPEEYFANPSCNKSNLESVEIHQSFSGALYENSLNMANPEIFEPENLSMHSTLMTDNTIGFDSVPDVKYKYLTSKMNAIKNPDETMVMDCDESVCFKKGLIESNLTKINLNDNESKADEMLTGDANAETVKTSPENKSTLKFTPDMFFADLPGNECTENKSSPSETNPSK